ncbi:MAG: hypothetical protein ACLFUB_18495 [Cyclobacteriaceae bacterium]
MNKNIYFFALWAEDIGQYLHIGYNSQKISEVEAALREYISVDETGDEKYDKLSLVQVLLMTGLSLDYSNSVFVYHDELHEKTLNQRKGNEVPLSFLS